MPVVSGAESKLKAKNTTAYTIISGISVLVLLIISLSFVVGSTYTVFIYFNF